MAVQPLSPATDRLLGGPLPHQLANQTQAHLPAASLWRLHHAVLPFHTVLATVSGCYSALEGRLLTRYSPVRHWCISTPVRLECVMHAASVNPEPGSNSLKNSISNVLRHQTSFSELFCLSFFFYFVMSFSKFFNEIPSHFSVLLRNFFVVQFSMIKWSTRRSICCILSGIFHALNLTAYLLYIKLLKLSTLFWNFFWFFSLFISFEQKNSSFPFSTY